MDVGVQMGWQAGRHAYFLLLYPVFTVQFEYSRGRGRERQERVLSFLTYIDTPHRSFTDNRQTHRAQRPPASDSWAPPVNTPVL